MIKRKTKKSKSKKRKNPYDHNIDKHYAVLLAKAFYTGDPVRLSDAISYLHIGFECDECDESFSSCTCEGARNIEFDSITHQRLTDGPCEECGLNRCLCDYDIWKNNKIDEIKISKLSWILAKRDLNENYLFNEFIAHIRQMYVIYKNPYNKYTTKIIKEIMSYPINDIDFNKLKKLK